MNGSSGTFLFCIQECFCYLVHSDSDDPNVFQSEHNL